LKKRGRRNETILATQPSSFLWGGGRSRAQNTSATVSWKLVAQEQRFQHLEKEILGARMDVYIRVLEFPASHSDA
jgi:hypothetical protein